MLELLQSIKTFRKKPLPIYSIGIVFWKSKNF